MVNWIYLPKNAPFVNGAIKKTFSKQVSLVAGKWNGALSHWIIVLVYSLSIDDLIDPEQNFDLYRDRVDF